MDYAKIIENLNTESIIHLMTELGADRYSETDEYILFPTICHNIDASEASMKLYYYKKQFISLIREGEEEKEVSFVANLGKPALQIKNNAKEGQMFLGLLCAIPEKGEVNIQKISSILFSIDFDGLAANGDAVLTCAYSACMLVSTLSGIILQKMSEHGRRSQVINRDHFITLSTKHLTECQTANTTKTINSNFNRHGNILHFKITALRYILLVLCGNRYFRTDLLYYNVSSL